MNFFLDFKVEFCVSIVLLYLMQKLRKSYKSLRQDIFGSITTFWRASITCHLIEMCIRYKTNFLIKVFVVFFDIAIQRNETFIYIFLIIFFKKIRGKIQNKNLPKPVLHISSKYSSLNPLSNL